MIPQDMKDEMRQDMLMEARQDEAEERRMRTDWEFAIEQIDKGNCSLDIAIKTIKAISKKLNSLGWVTSPQDLLDLLGV